MAARGELERARVARRNAARRLDQQTYKMARAAVQERANGACEARFAPSCAGLGDQAHHKLRRSQGGQHDPENLLWVCTPCHTEIHSLVETATELGFLRRSA